MPNRCADCRKPLKPVVSLDIDGTIGDYHGHFIWFAQNYLNVELPAHSTYDGSVRFWQHLGLELEVYRNVKLAYRQGGVKRWMPVYEGARELSHGLRAIGCEVWIATTRPHLRLDNIDPDTREFLKRNDIAYDHMIYGDDKYAQLDELVEAGRVVGALEDLPEQMEHAAAAGIDAVLRENFHNAEYSGTSVPNLYSALALLGERVVEWHEQQAA